MKRTKPHQNNHHGIHENATACDASSHVPTIDEEVVLEYASSAKLIVSKRLVKHIGPVAAIFVGNLLSNYKQLEEAGELRDDGSFTLTYKDQQEQTGMSIHHLRESKKTLVALGILTTIREGVPAKEYYYIDFDRLFDVTFQDVPI